MTVPAFSVFVSTRNAAPWIAKCLASLRSQSFADWEAVFIDDASVDNTWAAAIEAIAGDPRIRPIRNCARQRQVGAFLQAWPQLSGRVIVELDGDDWLLHDDALAEINRLYDIGQADATAGRAAHCNGTSSSAFPFEIRSFWDRLAHSYAPRSWHRRLFERAFAENAAIFYDPVTHRPWASAGDVVLFGVAALYADRILATENPVYCINRRNGESDWVVEPGLQVDCARRIRLAWESIIPADQGARLEFERWARAREEQIRQAPV